MFAHPIFVFNNRLLREAIVGTDHSSFLVAMMIALYAAILIALSFYGGHRYMVALKYWKGRKRPQKPAGHYARTELPGVTLQLPLYNEMYVIDRLLDAVGKLDYPLDRLQIQVLDDSTDESTEVARQAVAKLQSRGFDISLTHRTDRSGFKAGALANGLKSSKYDLVAILDADFVPNPDFLLRAVDHFIDPKVAVVQGRWGHLNERQSLLTEVQGLMLDGHFLVEHAARSRNGLFINFNGTAGLWRKEAIADAGGWQADTLTEDLDLSYRAQLKGWKFVFDPEIVCPAELPIEMNAFKSQQHRWAKGSIQVMCKVLPDVLRSKQPFRVKMEAFFHLTSNLCYLLMIPMFLMSLPMLVLRARIADGMIGAVLDWGIFFCATASMLFFYTMTLVIAHRDWWKRLHLVPMMLAIGIGLAVNQARAVIEALLKRESAFIRTPKFNLDARSSATEWTVKRYRGIRHLSRWVELAFALYFTFVLFTALREGLYGTLPFLLLFFIGFWYVTILTFAQGTRRGAKPVAQVPAQLPSPTA